MADPIEQPSAAPAGAPAPAAIPAAITPEPVVAAAPALAEEVAVVAPAAPAPAAPPAAGAEAAIAPAAEAPAVDVTKSEPTLLEQHDAAKEAAAPKKDAAKPEGEVAKPVVEAAPAELPKIDYFAAEGGVKLPETLSMDDTQRGEFVTAMDAFRAKPGADTAQAILDMGTKAMSAYAEKLQRDQFTAFNDTRKTWRDQVKADPVIGGVGYDTAMAAIADVRNALVPEADRKSFNEFLRVTGAGDNPAFLRMMHTGARFFKEASVPPPNPQPAPDNGRRPGRGKGNLYPNTEFKQ